jgi:hypothetical protein
MIADKELVFAMMNVSIDIFEQFLNSLTYQEFQDVRLKFIATSAHDFNPLINEEVGKKIENNLYEKRKLMTNRNHKRD